MAVHRKLLLALVVVCLPLACLAQTAVYPLPKLTGLLSHNSWTIADFDGDGKPDLVTSSEAAAPSYGHDIEFHFGAFARQTSSFRVLGESVRLNLIAWDVDGDHDLDLVVTSAGSDRLVGVWINDGQGRFSPGKAPGLTSDLFSLSNKSFSVPVFRTSRLLFLAQQRRAPDSLRASESALRLPSAYRAAGLDERALPRQLTGARRYGRAPPFEPLSL